MQITHFYFSGFIISLLFVLPFVVWHFINVRALTDTNREHSAWTRRNSLLQSNFLSSTDQSLCHVFPMYISDLVPKSETWDWKFVRISQLPKDGQKQAKPSEILKMIPWKHAKEITNRSVFVFFFLMKVQNIIFFVAQNISWS